MALGGEAVIQHDGSPLLFTLFSIQSLFVETKITFRDVEQVSAQLNVARRRDKYFPMAAVWKT